MDSKNQEILEEAKELFNSSAEVMKQMDRNVLQELRKSGETAVSKLNLLKAEMTILYWPKNIYPIFPKKDPQKIVL